MRAEMPCFRRACYNRGVGGGVTHPRLKPSELPGWPRWLTEPLAAAYVGVGVALFRGEVKAGKWPPAQRRGKKSGLLTWDREALDRASDGVSSPINQIKQGMLERAKGYAANLCAVSV
jgi:hypothetical protein